MFSDLAVLMFSCVLINNILLIQYLGNCPFLGTSKKMETATGMAMAVVFVLVLAGIITWLVEWYVLVPYDLKYLRTIAFILVIAALVQFVEMFLKKSIPGLYTGLGIYLPLITTNCAVLGVCLININENYDFFKMVVSSFAYPVGFRPGARAVCRRARADPARPHAQAFPGHGDRPGDRGNALAGLFRLQRMGLKRAQGAPF